MHGRTLRLFGILLAFGLTISGLCQIAVDRLWFAEVGYEAVFWRRLFTQVGIWSVVAAISALFLGKNLSLAQRLKHPPRQDNRSILTAIANYQTVTSRTATPSSQPTTIPGSPVIPISLVTPSLPLRWLLPIVLGLIGVVIALVWQPIYGSVTLWNGHLAAIGRPPTAPDRLPLDPSGQIGNQLWTWVASTPAAYFVIGAVVAGALIILRYPTVLLGTIAIIESVGVGLLLAARWGSVLQFFHAVAFDRADPLFAADIGFYVFSLPIAELLAFWFTSLLLLALLAVALMYLLSGDSLSQGEFAGFSSAQVRHLSALSGGYMLAVGFQSWLNRYELLYSTRGATYGAGYIDVNVLLPMQTALSGLAGAIALVLFWRVWRWRTVESQRPGVKRRRKKVSGTVTSRMPMPAALLLPVAFLAIALLFTTVLPDMLQRLLVQPTELAREEPFIRRSIAETRAAFALETIETEPFNPQGTLTFEELLKNQQTTRNIRLWDTRPLLETNRQLQQIRPYYRFFDADIDRYEFRRQPSGNQGEGASAANPVVEKQQVLIAARELDYTAVPSEARTWVNEHLVYTHGYGFTLSPVNQVAAGGLPDYYVKDIGVSTDAGSGGLSAADASIRASIPTANPRIYYGELTNTYIMTGTRAQELDYPSGSDNVYNVYGGAGGIAVNAFWQRCLLAAYLKDWRMLFTTDFTPQTKLLLRRNINERIRTIAPFLRYDHDPYLVVADVNQAADDAQNATRSDTVTPGPTPNYLYWIVDAYTTSDRYPYSAPSQISATSGVQTTPQGEKFNYIRNSVKVVIDAYNGSVSFYTADPQDPILRSWAAVFPTLFQPLSQMPAALRSHIRYPADLFSVQAERLMTYHMTDPQVFYNREDLWKVPAEIYGNQPQLVEPYYLITKLTTGKDEEFVLLLPFTPNQRTNLTAWLAARSDGENYGKSLLYVFPKQQLVYGTEQIEARINQDPVISQQISLWNRAGSRALQGNLLVIPINQSLLYVEPLYLEAEQNSLPTLVRVIVAYENRIAMAPTLDQALRSVFQSQEPTAPAIVRPVP